MARPSRPWDGHGQDAHATAPAWRRSVKWAAGLALVTAIATTVWMAAPTPEPRILGYDQLTRDGRNKHTDLVTDGARVYFNEQTAAGWVIAGVSALGGMTQAPERTAGKLVIHTFDLETRQLSDVPGSEGLWTARWSPDGRYLSALTEDSRTLMLFDFRTRRWTKLASLTLIPDVIWSRHEEAIYFNGEPVAGDRAVFRVGIPGGKVERVASLDGQTDRDWLGLAPDDSPLVARRGAAREIYAMTVNWP